jgi:hypothetical protein
MFGLNGYRMRFVISGFVAAIFLVSGQVANAAIINQAPIADAGSSRYAAQKPIVLNGIGSYDPDNSGTLTYAWEQIAGPPIIIIDADTATPTICGSVQVGTERDAGTTLCGFTQTNEIQECKFKLVVGDGELISAPDTVKVIIVPAFVENPMANAKNEMVLENPVFDPQKPTVVFFDGAYSSSDLSKGGHRWDGVGWKARANIISFVPYVADPGSPIGWDTVMTFSRCADMIIVYLSSVAPDYNQRIQTMGQSLGGIPAIDVALRMNKIYADARYAVNHVSFLDATDCLASGEYATRVADFLANPVDGEQCWLDTYYANTQTNYRNALNVKFIADGTVEFVHGLPRDWYRQSLIREDMNLFNSGSIAGAYWSVVGLGKNLQLASTPGVETYKFTWYGNELSGYMDFDDESNYPGRLPEPVTLWAWRDSLDSNSIVLTCRESDNAVGYELLFGPDPYRVMDYNIISDSPIPPYEVMTDFPFEETWWTIRARDQYGSTIYADPIRIDIENLPWPTIENLATGQKYGCIQVAIDQAVSGDEIVIGPGTYQENIDFKGKNLTLTSINPNDPTTVSATVIKGAGQYPVVSLSRGQGTGCVFNGLTISGGIIGISCGDVSLTIRNCTIESTGPNSIEFLYGYEPIIIDCIILGPISEVYDPRLIALWKMDETEGSIAYDSIGTNDSICYGEPIWQPAGGILAGALEFDGIDDYISTDFVLSPSDDAFSVFAWIKGGAPGQVIVSQEKGMNWLMTNISDGTLRTDLKEPAKPGRNAKPVGPPLFCSTVVTSDDWHRIGFVRDGSYRTLYVDDIAVAEDTQESLEYSDGGLYIGCDKALGAGTFWSGLIDDVRIYNRVVRP